MIIRMKMFKNHNSNKQMIHKEMFKNPCKNKKMNL